MTTTGYSEAARLALYCFMTNISEDGFYALPMDEQLAFASNAGLSGEQLGTALEFLKHYPAKPSLLQVYIAGDGPAAGDFQS